MGSHNRNPKHSTCQYIRSSHTAANHCRPCTIDSRIWPLRPPQAKLHNSVSLRRIYYTRSLRSDQTLMIQNIQYCSFNQLRLHYRRHYFNKRFLWKYNASLLNCIDISCKSEGTQIFQKFRSKTSCCLQIFNILICKPQLVYIIQHLF